MTELPPLPDSEDPFAILGVGRDIDAVELKRAYIRLIKLYKPDRAPKEFARIRDAYSEAQDMLRSGWDDSDDWTETSAAPVPESAATAWGLLAEGREDEARRSLLSGQPASGIAAAHRFLLTEALDSDGARRHLVEAFAEGIEVEDWIVSLLGPAELREIALLPEFDWPRLKDRIHREGVLTLLRTRCHALLLADRIDEAVELVSAPDFAGAAMDEPRLAYLAREVMCPAAWTDSNRAEWISDAFGAAAGDVRDGYLPEDHYRDMRDLAGAFRKWRAKFPELEALQRLLKIGPALDAAEIGDLADAAHVEFHELPDRMYEGFDAMSGDLLERYISYVASFPWPDEDADKESVGMLRTVLQNADAQIRTSTLHDWGSTFLGLLLIGSLGSFFLVGWWGFAVVVGTVFVMIVLLGQLERATYRRVLRGPLVRLVIETPLSPVEIVRYGEAHEKQLEKMDSFLKFVARDRTLVALHWTRRLGELRTEMSPPDHA